MEKEKKNKKDTAKWPAYATSMKSVMNSHGETSKFLPPGPMPDDPCTCTNLPNVSLLMNSDPDAFTP